MNQCDGSNVCPDIGEVLESEKKIDFIVDVKQNKQIKNPSKHYLFTMIIN